MMFTEEAVGFSAAGENLLGIVANPELPSDVGLLIIVGGPQYRVGSHRQFVLLARAMAVAGYTTMRFDYRGMGDSTGAARAFESVSEDVGVAIDAFLLHHPAIKRVALWGLCDAASAALLYIQETGDPRVAGLVLLNPWVRSEASLAQTHIKHYYRQRLLQREFWSKLLRGKLELLRSLRHLLRDARQARALTGQVNPERFSFQEKMGSGLRKFSGAVLIILSGRDFTAKEFQEFVATNSAWSARLSAKNVEQVMFSEADHTFSSQKFRHSAESATLEFLSRI